MRCAGQSLSRTTYSALFKIVGTRFGTANSGSFNVPDIRRRQIVGRNAEWPVGTRAGAETKLLSINQLPTHRHGHSSITVSERPDARPQRRQYVYGENEFPELEAGGVAIIGPCAEMHRVPDGTQGWRFIDGNPYDFPAARTGTPTKPRSIGQRRGARPHSCAGLASSVEAYGGGEEF